MAGDRRRHFIPISLPQGEVGVGEFVGAAARDLKRIILEGSLPGFLRGSEEPLLAFVELRRVDKVLSPLQIAALKFMLEWPEGSVFSTGEIRDAVFGMPSEYFSGKRRDGQDQGRFARMMWNKGVLRPAFDGDVVKMVSVATEGMTNAGYIEVGNRKGGRSALPMDYLVTPLGRELFEIITRAGLIAGLLDRHDNIVAAMKNASLHDDGNRGRLWAEYLVKPRV